MLYRTDEEFVNYISKCVSLVDSHGLLPLTSALSSSHLQLASNAQILEVAEAYPQNPVFVRFSIARI